MTIKYETGIADFKAWSGAVYTQDVIINSGKEDAFNELIAELYPDGIDEMDLNDLLWHDTDWVFDTLGIEEEEED